MKAIKGHPYEFAYELIRSTGLRSDEVRGLQWEDINFEKKEIHVRSTLVQNRQGVSLDAPKTKSSYQDLPMLKNVYQLLKKKRTNRSSSDSF